nr:MAG TPA: hypothetical protein [Caudoviricetes sp.]
MLSGTSLLGKVYVNVNYTLYDNRSVYLVINKEEYE